MAADVWQVCDALRLDRVHFVGLSLGGMIGLAASLANQNRTSSLTMINSSIGGNLFPRLSVKAVGALVTDMARSRDTLKTVATYLIGGVSDERRDWIVERWQEIEEEEPVTVGLLQAQLWAAARFRVRKLLHNLKVPVLIYCARDDRFVPIINSSLLHAQIPRSEYKVVDHGGHEATAAFPQETARDIAEFIERCALKNQSPSVTKRQRPASKKSNR
jgi:3-oxoadipate enol-lactonase